MIIDRRTVSLAKISIIGLLFFLMTSCGRSAHLTSISPERTAQYLLAVAESADLFVTVIIEAEAGGLISRDDAEPLLNVADQLGLAGMTAVELARDLAAEDQLISVIREMIDTVSNALLQYPASEGLVRARTILFSIEATLGFLETSLSGGRRP